MNETFEKETVGKFPSLWTAWNETPIPKETVVTDNPPRLSKGLKALMVSHDGLNQNWGIQREFDGVELDPSQTIEWGFKLNVQALPKSKQDLPGFVIYLQNGKRPLPFACFCIHTQNEGHQWMLFNINYAKTGGHPYLVKDLEINDWHETRFVITMKPGDTLSGEVEWIFDGEPVTPEKLSNVPVALLYADSLVIRPLIASSPLEPTKVLVTNLFVRTNKTGKAPSPSLR